MDQAQINSLKASYDAVAEEYVARIFDELQHKPLDRELLWRFAKSVSPQSTICDLGCGPGQIARYLSEQGAQVTGIDLSPQMIALAKQLNPTISFQIGNMLKLNFANESLGGIAALYSLIHIPPAEVVAALQECNRVLTSNGKLLLSFHVGEEIRHLDEWWGKAVSVDFYFFQVNEMKRYLCAAGFEIEEIIERPPYTNVEAPTNRAYICAKKPN